MTANRYAGFAFADCVCTSVRTIRVLIASDQSGATTVSTSEPANPRYSVACKQMYTYVHRRQSTYT